MKIISTAALHPLKHALITIMLSRGKEKKKMVSSCAYGRFNTVSNSPREADPLISQSKQLQAQLQRLVLLFFFFNGTCADKHTGMI